MRGVNLIDFTMPSAVPAPAGGKVGNVEGTKLVLPKKVKGEKNADTTGEQAKMDWWKAFLPLLGIFIVVKLATRLVRRKG